VMCQAKVVIEVIGEGRTDVGVAKMSRQPIAPSPPNSGVLPIIVHSLCGKPDTMCVVRRQYASLQGKTRAQKVHFAIRQAIYSPTKPAGLVFALDSEGDLAGRRKELTEGRDRAYADFPAALGIAHPCIEAWLLADADAVRHGLNLAETPSLPGRPEELPAPCRDRKGNPKAVLRDIAAGAGLEIAADDKDRIACKADLLTVATCCPLGFAPFAEEVRRHIRPLFTEPCPPA
jgi:hypothetical protein